MIRTVRFLSLVVLISSPAFAQTVGDTVVVVRECDIMSENMVVDIAPLGLSFAVTKVSGKWLWVNNGVPGWLDRANTTSIDQAIPYFTEQIRQEPTASAYYGRALIWGGLKEYDNAIADYSEAIQLDPSSIAYYNNRGSCWKKKGEWHKAIVDYTAAIRLDKNGGYAAQIYMNRGDAWVRKKDYDMAIADYDEAIRIKPKYQPLYAFRANAWSGKREYRKAIDDYSWAIRLDSKDVGSVWGRAICYALIGEYHKQIDDMSLLMRLTPNDPRPFNYTAWIRATCPDAKYRDGQKAVQDAKIGCELSDWKQERYIETLAAAYAEVGNFDEAVKWQEKAMGMAAAEEKTEYRTRLDLYKSGKPYRLVLK